MAAWTLTGADPGYEAQVANLLNGAGGVPALSDNAVQSDNRGFAQKLQIVVTSQ